MTSTAHAARRYRYPPGSPPPVPRAPRGDAAPSASRAPAPTSLPAPNRSCSPRTLHSLLPTEPIAITGHRVQRTRMPQHYQHNSFCSHHATDRQVMLPLALLQRPGVARTAVPCPIERCRMLRRRRRGRIEPRRNEENEESIALRRSLAPSLYPLRLCGSNRSSFFAPHSSYPSFLRGSIHPFTILCR